MIDTDSLYYRENGLIKKYGALLGGLLGSSGKDGLPKRMVEENIEQPGRRCARLMPFRRSRP